MAADRTDKAIELKPDGLIITEEDVRLVRAREKYVPGFTYDDDPTHLTRGFLKMTALCGHYPVRFCGDSPSGKWCQPCIDVANDDRS